MSLQGNFFSKTFQFNFKARTSRGLMNDKTSWFIRLWDDTNPGIIGIGECGPLKGLSTDHRPDFQQHLEKILHHFLNARRTSVQEIQDLVPPDFPSIIFGLETALLDLHNGGQRIIFSNSFRKGVPIPINGLIWMGDMDFMMTQINDKISRGFRCIKLKVGGLDFDSECDVLSYIRRRYFRENVTIRLDANGAFKLDDVLYKLEELAKFQVHSIEQPIRPGLAEMEELCRKSPIPIAFDEELIGKNSLESMGDVLDKNKPQYIVLKPTLHGGLERCRQWIMLAEERGIGWWMTSALESGIGLNAICQFTAEFGNDTVHGLGTGGIYNNNFTSPLVVEDGKIFYSPHGTWQDQEFRN